MHGGFHLALPLVVRHPTLSGVRDAVRTRAGMLICVVVGHAVEWGPCPRCHRRALG